MENLNEGKKKKMSYMAELAEIDKQSAIVAMEAKINKLAEMIEAKNTRLNMVSEDENLSELIDKQRVREMQREIKILEKEKSKMEKMYEKMGAKKKEMVDEEKKDDEMNEGGYGMPSYEEDDDKPSMEEEIDEAHCNTEEDDTDSMNEEFLRMQKLAGVISEEEYKTQVNELFGIGKGKKNEWHFANQYSDNDYQYYGTLKGPKNGKDEKGADKAMDKHIDQTRKGAVLILAKPGYTGFNGRKTAGEISDDPKVISTKTYMYNR